MPLSSYWADKYIENKRSAHEAIGLIKPAQRVFIGSSCGEPQHLVRALSEASNYFKDIEKMIEHFEFLRNGNTVYVERD